MIGVNSRISAIISEQLGIGEDEVAPDSSFVADLGCDSLDVVEIILAVEEEFEIEVPDHVVDDMETVGSLIQFVEKHVQ